MLDGFRKPDLPQPVVQSNLPVAPNCDAVVIAPCLEDTKTIVSPAPPELTASVAINNLVAPSHMTLANTGKSKGSKSQMVSAHRDYVVPLQSGETPVPAASAHKAADPSAIVNSKSLLITVNGETYRRIELVGRGASSKVYKVLCERTGRIYALKKVKLGSTDGDDASTVEGYLGEIALLKRLNAKEDLQKSPSASGIIRLIDSEVCWDKKCLLLLLEYGEIDLAHLLLKDKTLVGNLNFIRMNWAQMLKAVQQIHNEKIVHSDLKPANFLIVEGTLKLIDFGIAKAIPSDTTNIQRDYQTGTLNYMAPEAIVFTEANSSKEAHLKLGRSSDIWSLGCILYQLTYGQPPFASLPVVQKLNAIVDPNYKISFKDIGDPALLEVLKSCLDRDPKKRMTIPQLLEHPFLQKSEVTDSTVLMTPGDMSEMLIDILRRERKDSNASDVRKEAEQLANEFFAKFRARRK
ncbi:hypothetical protein HDU84_000658 [Entophlyctis sp. JEL0112]|nr:hypothetical protein HDU84_000658 [Entophlyctis sp. JEL0112]